MNREIRKTKKFILRLTGFEKIESEVENIAAFSKRVKVKISNSQILEWLTFRIWKLMNAQM